MTMDATEAKNVLNDAEILYTEDQVYKALDRIAEEITRDISAFDPLVLCVMTGAIIPAGHLLTRLNFPLQIDYIHATSYRGDTRGGKLNWIVRPQYDLRNRNVLIIDDIYDEGVTLAAIIESCWEMGAHDVRTAVVINKLHDRKKKVKVDYIGLETGDRYLFGCGMDYKGYLRNLPGIYAVKGM